MTRQLSLSLTSSQQDTLASPSLRPVKSEVKLTPDIFGPTSEKSSSQESPLGVCSRMLLDTSIWGSTRCCLTWKKTATKQGRLLFRLSPSMLPTRDFESGFWPTPQAGDNISRGHLGNPCVQRRIKIGKQVNLSMVVSDKSGKLNPTWVEWLMGYPINHTELSPLETPSSLK